MSFEVFICYSSQDTNIANTVCTALESKHLHCWIAPRDVLPGELWGDAVADAIDNSHIVVLVLSFNSCNSSQVIREIERAASNNTTIIPLRIDDTPISRAISFFVSSRHWLNAQTPPLEKHLQQLADTIKRLLEHEKLPYKNTKIPETEEKPVVLLKEDAGVVKTFQQALHCPRCGVQLRPGAGFCNKCGASVSESEKETPTVPVERPHKSFEPVLQAPHCPKCGVQLRPDAGFCNKCGARISEGQKVQ